jgi:hypothetical protein
MKAGAVNGLSIAFEVTQAAFDWDVRHLVELRMKETDWSPFRWTNRPRSRMTRSGRRTANSAFMRPVETYIPFGEQAIASWIAVFNSHTPIEP